MEAKKKGSLAFTLAEVLITLAIIGVVAALTIPVILAKYQKHVWVSQLEKNYSVLNDAFQQAMINDGVGDFGQTQIIQKINGTSTSSSDDQTAFFNELGKVLKISKFYNKNEIPSELQYKFYFLGQSGESTSYAPRVILQDGTILYLALQKTPTSKDKDKVKKAGGTMWNSYGSILIDLNGVKEPNTYGRDIFNFYVSQDGLLVPMGSMNYSIWISLTYALSWRKTNDCSTSGSGIFCAARVLEERAMNY